MARDASWVPFVIVGSPLRSLDAMVGGGALRLE